MSCSSGIASANSILVAIRTAFERAASGLSSPADLAILFVSGESLADRSAEILELWKDLAPEVPFFGGSAESLVGLRTEVEGGCGASILLVSGLHDRPFIHELECIKTPDGPSVMGVTEELLEKSKLGLMLVACPVSFSMELLADVLDLERSNPKDPICPIMGGYTSSQNWSSPNLIFCGDRILEKGASALVLPEGWEWKTIVSQGCRPIGEPMVITQMDDQAIIGLGGKPAMQQLRELFASLPTNEQQMMSNSLMVGRAINEYSETFSHGEFLIRAVQGIDSSTQGLLVTDRFQVGQTIRFHLRDAGAASADLQNLLSRSQSAVSLAQGGLLFTCNGRGTRMFDKPNHDARTIDHYYPNLPIAGIFAAGEFGPVANQNLVHGFTAILHLLVQSNSSD
jgi:small ligand-binding sensory domain FIST